MHTVLIVIHLMIVLAMVGLVLLQKSEGGGLGLGGGGGGGGFLSSRGTANVLTRTTAILAAAFFATSLLLSVLAGFERKPRSALDSSVPAIPGAPSAPGTPSAPAAAQPPAAPAEPQVPTSRPQQQ